jgi:hypothetical protein
VDIADTGRVAAVTPDEYRKACAFLDLPHTGKDVPRVLGITIWTSSRYATGAVGVDRVVERLLRALVSLKETRMALRSLQDEVANAEARSERADRWPYADRPV